MSRLTKVTVNPPDRRGKFSIAGTVEHEAVALPFEWRAHEDEDVAQHAAHVDVMKGKAEKFVAKCGDCRKHKDTSYPTAFGEIVFTAVGLAYEGPEHWHLRAFWEERRSGSVRCRKREITVGDPSAADPDSFVAGIVAEYPSASAQSRMAVAGDAAVEVTACQKHNEALFGLLG